MSSVNTINASIHTDSDQALLQFATCHLCHTTSVSVTIEAIVQGALWHCARCGHGWSAHRLAAVTAYDAWLANGGTDGRH